MTDRCSSCAAELPAGSRACPRCGSPAASSTATRTSAPEEAPPAHLSGDAAGHPSIDRGRFAPGDLVSRRYRIVGLLGRGGMGEVYRADDLKLGQPVALKFLPERLERDPDRLARLLNEVRTARQVAHPNVCRVYDVAEVDGRHFLSMEYVDGEDLASLLRRIGRLPEDRALQLARELCAGLAAAHQEGILHRDLKPANVMIDGRGRARITDFGLAGLAETFSGPEIRAGTPAYMAPEQLDGREVSVRSDLYALGLVLYELFTGTVAFREEEARSASRSAPPDSLANRVPGIDPAIERAVMRCLEPRTADRPASAMAVSASLPGGDALAAALAAGETPSPEMVAAAGGVGGLRSSVAVALLATVLVGLVVIAATQDRAYLQAQVELPTPAETLAYDARRIIEEVGHGDAAVDHAHGFVYDADRLGYERERGGADGDWSGLFETRPGPITFWYRSSPRYLIALDFTNVAVTERDPEPVVAGMAGARLDPTGRLLQLYAVPSPVGALDGPSVETDWTTLFEHAALDRDAMRPVPPERTPPVFADRRYAWEGTYPDQPDLPIRVEAASLAGRPVHFELRFPWTPPEEAGAELTPDPIDVFSTAFLFVILAGAALLARVHVRRGRGDRRGAFRFAAFVFVVNLAVGVLGGHHIPTFDEGRLVFEVLAWSTLVAGMVWIVYLALEPYARRLWPDLLISWSRLLSGRIRDPLIGRDALVGGAAGVVWVMLSRLSWIVPAWFDWPLPEPAHGQVGGFKQGALYGLESLPHAFSTHVHHPQLAISNVLAAVFVLVVLRLVLRRVWIATAATYLLFASVGLSISTNGAIDIPIALVTTAIFVGVLVRFGMLAATALMAIAILDQVAVLTIDPSAWYSGRAWFLLAVIAGAFAYAFTTSLAGRPLLEPIDR